MITNPSQDFKSRGTGLSRLFYGHLGWRMLRNILIEMLAGRLVLTYEIVSRPDILRDVLPGLESLICITFESIRKGTV